MEREGGRDQGGHALLALAVLLELKLVICRIDRKATAHKVKKH